MADFFEAWDAKRNPAPSTVPVAFAPAPPGRDVSRYAAAALAGECDNIRAVPIGSGRNDQLNKSAVKMGHLIAAGAIDEQTVVEHLGAADGGLDYPATRKTIASGLAFGMREAKIIPDRQDVPEWLLPAQPATTSPARLAELPATSAPPSPSCEPASDPFADALSTSPNGSTATPPASTTGGAADASATTGEPPSVGSPAVGDASGSAAPDAPQSRSIGDLVRERLPIVDWFTAWNAKTVVDWIAYPLLPARRLVAIYSLPKVGKSLLLLELAYAVSRGADFLGSTTTRARVLYVDFENDLEGDIVPRLRNMGAEPDQLGALAYLSLPTLGALDSEQGSLELLAAIDEYRCEVVVIDTLSRSVDGDENENDTWLKFYRHTGLKLKQRGVSLVRLDHSGKDEAKGQRGGSAKSGDVDAVWRMSRLTDGNDGQPETFRLVCEANRFPLTEKLLTILRHENPLRHIVRATGSRDIIVEAIVAYLDDNGVPLTRGRSPELLAEIKAGGVPGATQLNLTAALKHRKAMRDGGAE